MTREDVRNPASQVCPRSAESEYVFEQNPRWFQHLFKQEKPWSALGAAPAARGWDMEGRPGLRWGFRDGSRWEARDFGPRNEKQRLGPPNPHVRGDMMS